MKLSIKTDGTDVTIQNGDDNNILLSTTHTYDRVKVSLDDLPLFIQLLDFVVKDMSIINSEAFDNALSKVSNVFDGITDTTAVAPAAIKE